MAQTVTIEGSIRPCVDLPRGQRKTVVLTDRVQKLIKLGYFDVVEYHDEPSDEQAVAGADTDGDGEDEGKASEGDDPTEPKPTASTQDWKDWFDAQVPPIPYPDDVQRKQLIHAWKTMQQAKAQAG